MITTDSLPVIANECASTVPFQNLSIHVRNVINHLCRRHRNVEFACNSPLPITVLVNHLCEGIRPDHRLVKRFGPFPDSVLDRAIGHDKLAVLQRFVRMPNGFDKTVTVAKYLDGMPFLHKPLSKAEQSLCLINE